MISYLYSSVRTLFKNIFPTPKSLSSKIIPLFLGALVLVCSGTTVFNFLFSSKVKISIYVVVALAFLTLFVLSFDVNQVRNLRENKKKLIPPFYAIYCLLFCFGVFLSFLFNGNKSLNLNPYISLLFMTIVAFLIVSIWSFDYFVKFFDYLILISSCISILCFFFVSVSGFNFSSEIFYRNNSYSNYWNILYVFTRFYYTSGVFRFMSIFWEPGVFATFLVLSIVIELCFKKTNYFHIGFFVLCLLLTFSTAGYVLLIPVILIWIWEKVKDQSLRKFLYFLVVFLLFFCLCFYSPIMSFLAKSFPSIFGKIESDSSSLITRVFSPYYYFLVFLKSPVFGFGPTSANVVYFSVAGESGVDARTSTTGFMLASYGIVGFLYTLCPLLGLLFNRKKSWFVKIPLAIIFLAIINKENHSEILLLNALYMYFAADFQPWKRVESEPSYRKQTVSDLLVKRKNARVVTSNIYWSFILKGGSIIVGFLTLPIYSLYFGNDSSYGVWLTIYSLLSWITIFDFGMGNGMKNQLISSFSIGDFKRSKEIISSIYFSTGLIALLIAFLLIPLIWFFDMNSFFNVSVDNISLLSLRVSLTIVVVAICFQFVLKNVENVLQAKRKNALANCFGFLTNAIMLIFVISFKWVSLDKFIFLSSLFALCLNLPLVLANLILFLNKDKGFAPSRKCFSFSVAKKVMTTGGGFFAIQLANTILYMSNSLLISRFFGPDQVVPYTEYYKLFGTIYALVAIYENTIWVEATKCFEQKEFSSLKKLIKLSYIFALLLSFVAILAFAFLSVIFDVWLGSLGNVSVDYGIGAVFLCYCITSIFAETGIIFSNAFTKLKSQLWIYLPAAILKIPLLFVYCHYAQNPSWPIIMIYTCFYSAVASIVIPICVFSYVKKAALRCGYHSNKEIQTNVSWKIKI